MATPSRLTAVIDRLSFILPSRFRTRGVPVVPVVRLSGVIGSGALPFRSGLSAAGVAGVLERAFGTRGAKAVALVINSPGGSAAQSHLIYRRVRQLAEEKSLPVLVFVEDAAASGGYMIACAGDEIIVDPASLVGSIGVVSAGFGFQDLIARFGIERRVHTAGESKAMLDPFRPEDPDDVARLKAIQAEIHALFANLVRARRGARLDAMDESLFSGAVWSGTQAVALGLADRLGDLRTTLRERYGEKVVLRVIPPARGGLLSRAFGRGEVPVQAGLVEPDALLAALEERAAWSRLGL